MPIPYATEEIWECRKDRRGIAVNSVKTRPIYITFFGDVMNGVVKPHKNRPTTPDPMDRTLSKRDWEKLVQQWRRDLQAWPEKIHGEDPQCEERSE